MKDNAAATTAAGIIVVLWVAALFLWAKPPTGYGKTLRVLLATNGGGWLLVLSVAVAGGGGHPPPFLYLALPIWLLNLLLLPAAATILWLCRKEAGERKSYLAVAAAYVVANVIVLYVIPIAWVYLH